VIDPGHGGIDPGAVAPGNLHEKQIVLEVSERVVRKLRKTGRFRVEATRTSDVFISLDDRVAFAQSRQADLFISLHADSLGDQRAARLVSGATVYTLSQRASDETARKMAEKENSSDILAGLIDVDRAAPEVVTTILFDLMARESSVFALDFAEILARQLKAKVPVARKARRSAAFKVLKQTQTPAVLLELGYMSNPKDRQLMQTEAWQEKVATAVMKSVESYFTKRLARSK